MPSNSFSQNFQAYAKWRQRLTHSVQEYQTWLERQGLATPDAQQHIKYALESLHNDKLTIAFVAEYSRGKTELINSMFFADQGRRLLPSNPGRTTMCPTELTWDEERNEAYVRLLPIETRTQDGTVKQLAREPELWVHYPLQTDSPEQMESTLRELVQTKQVSVAEAGRLGLYNEDLQHGDDVHDGMVDIPRWRHATVSFPHPLLKQGLKILDTPGLNALGNEPELTLSTLPSAQAVLFVLGADTGVTRSDLEMWQHHIKGFQSSRQQGLVVVLNKIDTLWDELKSDTEVEEIIEQQKTSSAKVLGIGEQAIFPVSAHKGLLGKIKSDRKLLTDSRLEVLEAYLAGDMLESRQQLVLESVESEVGQLIDNNRNLVAQQLANVKQQLGELEELRDKSAEVIQHLLEKTRVEQALYLESVTRFQASRTELQKEADELRQLLDMGKISALMEKTHHDMLHSWTTRGMKKSMKYLFDELRRAMTAVTAHSERTRKRVRATYQRFQNEFGFSSVQPHKFSIMKYRVELDMLYKEAEAFRKSPTLAISEQSFVVKRFYQVMVGRALEIFDGLNRNLDSWLSHALDPLVDQIQEHKDMMEKRLENLQKIGHSKNTLQARIEDLEGQYAELARQLTALRNMYNGIHLSRSMVEDAHPRPRLAVAN